MHTKRQKKNPESKRDKNKNIKERKKWKFLQMLIQAETSALRRESYVNIERFEPYWQGDEEVLRISKWPFANIYFMLHIILFLPLLFFLSSFLVLLPSLCLPCSSLFHFPFLLFLFSLFTSLNLFLPTLSPLL